EALLNQLGNVVAVAGSGVRGDQRFPFGLREPEEVALGLDFPAIGVLLVVERRRADHLLVVIVPQVSAVTAENQPVGRRPGNRTLGRLDRRPIRNRRRSLLLGEGGKFLEYPVKLLLAQLEITLPQRLPRGRGDDEMIAA